MKVKTSTSKRKRARRCWYCGKSQREVKKMVEAQAPPGLLPCCICDECVGLCIGLMGLWVVWPVATARPRFTALDHWHGRSRITTDGGSEHPDPAVAGRVIGEAWYAFELACARFEWDGSERLTLSEWRALLYFARTHPGQLP